MTQSVWVLRDREHAHYWNGFGYTAFLHEAHIFSRPPLEAEYEFLAFPVDLLELRLIERESDS